MVYAMRSLKIRPAEEWEKVYTMFCLPANF